MTAPEPLDPGTKRIFTVVAWASFAVIIVISAYGIVEALTTFRGAVGTEWVDVYWPFPPYFAQPVTYFSVACLALFYSGLRLWEARIAKWPAGVISFLRLLGFIVAFSAAYEVIYNFVFWGAAYSEAALTSHAAIVPDTLASDFPAPWNFVFATRIFATIFALSGYSVYFLRRLNRAVRA